MSEGSISLGGAIDYTIIGMFVLLSAGIVLVSHDPTSQVLLESEGVRSYVAAGSLVTVIWAGYTCSIIYRLLFTLRGGYESRNRPCIKDIVRRYRESTSEEDDQATIPDERMYPLAYYTWSYIQENESALSEKVIERVSQGWQRVHFLGSTIVSLIIGLSIIFFYSLISGEIWTLPWGSLIVLYLVVGYIIFLRWKKERDYLYRLERFIVAENWEFIEDSLDRVNSIRVEDF